jgi:hypothetical protein
MALATAIKPLGMVLLLLAPLVYTPLIARLPLAVGAVAVFPFLFASPGYVWGQYQEVWQNLQSCAAVTEHRFADINGVLRTFGTAFGPGTSTMVRVLAGGATAVIWWVSARRLREPQRALWLFALATGYLMLFNPMTEENSYGILAPALGAWGGFFLFSGRTRAEHILAWGIVTIALTMGFGPNIVRPLFGNYFALFWHPTMTILFLGWLGYVVWTSAAASAAPDQTSATRETEQQTHPA